MGLRRRPLVLSALTLLPAADRAFTQPTGKVHRIGVLGLAPPSANPPIWNAFIAELARRGYDEGRNLAFEIRYPGKDDTASTSWRPNSWR